MTEDKKARELQLAKLQRFAYWYYYRARETQLTSPVLSIVFQEKACFLSKEARIAANIEKE